MIKKIIIGILLVDIFQIVVGSLMLAHIETSGVVERHQITFLQIFFGGLIWFLSLYIYTYPRIRNVFSFCFFLLINVVLLFWISKSAWLNIIVASLYIALVFSIILVTTFRLKKI